MAKSALQKSVEQEVWKTVLELNDCWTKGDGSRLVDYFHPRMVAITPTTRERIFGQKACVAGWMEFAKTAKTHYLKEIDPQIELFGNTAVVTYDFDMSFDMHGQTITMSGRDMLTLVKENDKWWVVADQYSANP
jgi:hypothetical protein